MSVSPIGTIPSVTWQNDPANPVFSKNGGYNSFKGDTTSGLDIATLGFTPVSTWGTGVIETLANKTGIHLRNATPVAYIRDLECNRGRIMGVLFSWSAGLGNNKDILWVGRKVTVNNGQLSGYFSFLKHISGNNFKIRLERWDNGVIAGTWTVRDVIIGQGVPFEFFIGTQTYYGDAYTFTPVVNLRDSATYDYQPQPNSSYSSGHHDRTYSGTKYNGQDYKTLFGIGDQNLTVTLVDNGADSWYKAYVMPICVNGEYDNVYRDSQGRAHAVYQTGDAVSLDQASWLTTLPNEAPRFYDGCQTFKGVRGRVGPVIMAAEQENGVWPPGTNDLMGKAQGVSVMADVGAGEFKAYFCTDEGQENYRSYFASCPITSDPSDPANWTYEGQLNLGGADDMTGASPLKRDVIYNSVQYHYVSLFIRDYSDVYLCFSVSGRTNWVVGPLVASGIVNVNQFGYDAVQNKYFALLSRTKVSGIGQNDLWTAPNGVNNLPGSWTKVNSNVGPLPGGSVGNWNYRWHYDGCFVYDGGQWIWHYAGDPNDTSTNRNWPDNTTGVATYGTYTTPSSTQTQLTACGATYGQSIFGQAIYSELGVGTPLLGVNISISPGTVTAQATAPSVGIPIVTNISVQPATATAQTATPTISVGITVNVNSAISTAQSVAPNVSVGTMASIQISPATVNVQAISPNVDIGVSATIQVTPASANVLGIAPTIYTVAEVDIRILPSMASTVNKTIAISLVTIRHRGTTYYWRVLPERYKWEVIS